MIKNNFLFALILVSLAKLIFPQEDLRFEQLSLQEGVAHNLTYTMMKDSKGFLWFGTMYGLARYEGTGYTVFKHKPDDPKSISFDDIVSLFEDSKGNIWIGTWGGGLNMYDPYKGEFKRFVYQGDKQNTINDNIIWAICEDKKGNIWLGTERGGLNRYNPQTGKFSYYKNDLNNQKSIRSNSILSLLCDSDGNLWIGSKEGLSKYNYDNKSFHNFNYNGTVRVIFEDSEKNLWIGTTNGLNKFDGNSYLGNYQSDQSTNSISNNFIISITEDSKGNLWIGTANGLNRFNREDNTFTHFMHNPAAANSLGGNVIYNVIEDNSGILWVNAYNSGINKTIGPPKNNFQNYYSSHDKTETLSNRNVLSVAEGSDGLIWIGTKNGLNSINPQNGEITRIRNDGSQRSNIINALASDNNGNLWIGSNEGIKIYNPSYRFFIEPDYNGFREAGLLSTHVTSFLLDSIVIWIGTYDKGLFRFDRSNNSLSRFSFEGKYFSNYQSDYILSLFKDKLGRIWIGSYGGLMMYDKKNNIFSTHTNDLNDPLSLSNNYVFSILEDSKKNLWVGTSNGLNKFIYGSETFEHFFENDGLPNSVIYSVTEDTNGNLWISTNNGVSKFNYYQKSFTNYDISDGLGGNLFNPTAVLKTKSGNIVFGGNWGCTLFNPDNLSFSYYNPPVYISSIEKINTEGESSFITSLTDEIEIGSSEKTLIINFASLDYTNPKKNKIAYMLEGIDNTRKEQGDNSVTYTNLEPGEYLLTVYGTNSDGIYSKNFAELKIIVVPSFWQTWWFRLLLFLLIAALIFFIIRYKIKAKIKKEIETQKIREKEAERIRKQTAIDFHDELGHRLTRISLITEIIRKKLHNTFKEIDILLKSISENSQILYDGTRDFIWAIDPAQDSFYDLMIRLKDFGDELFSNTNINFKIKGINESLQKFPLTIEWKRHITMIFKEAMNNAIKYSGCKNIILEISMNNKNEVEIFLFDDGKGFNQLEKFEGHGLKNMRKRAEQISGTMDIDSRLNIGTKVLFRGIIPSIFLDYSRKVA